MLYLLISPAPIAVGQFWVSFQVQSLEISVIHLWVIIHFITTINNKC